MAMSNGIWNEYIGSINECYQRGWLHSEALNRDGSEIVLVFLSRLHAKWALPCSIFITLANLEHYYTSSSVPFPYAKFPTIEKLAESALRHFSLTQLSSNSTRHTVLSKAGKGCKACMAHGVWKRKVLDTTFNTDGRRPRAPCTRYGCSLRNIHLCHEGPCWEE